MADAAPSPSWYPPDKKVLVGALIGAAVSVVTSIAKRYGLDLAPELITALPVLFGFVAAYLVPMTENEVAARVTNKIVKIANADPENETTAIVVSKAKATEAAEKDIDLGVIDPPA